MTCDSKSLAEIVGTVASIIANYSAFQQTAHCIKTKSAEGIAWGSLKTRCIAIILFATSTFLFGGPVSMFIGNIFALTNVTIIMIIKGQKEHLFEATIKRIGTIKMVVMQHTERQI